MAKKNRMRHRDGGSSAVGGDGARFALIQTDSNLYRLDPRCLLSK